MLLISAALASTISAADCQRDMAFAVDLKDNGYVCLANSGKLYVKPGTNLDQAAAQFLQTLSSTARRLYEGQSQPNLPDRSGT